MNTALPLSPTALCARSCRDQHALALSAADVSGQLALLPHWRLVEGALERSFAFGNYYETIAFVNALAWICHRQDHHPDLAVSYNRCKVRFNTHSVKGISLNDFICAAQCDALQGEKAQPGA